ncbi:uncharacterized protein ARMOST_13608 [Armillaria ostoyae]|uniref:Uncharacterized protein n=1 Tax=Armillaria ostoyae TaxID=47428 RepID=A0A284RND0_ARMOS|nr:uncharacterized protein ARMOST_13608 [Armillaria ostoyae]
MLPSSPSKRSLGARLCSYVRRMPPSALSASRVFKVDIELHKFASDAALYVTHETGVYIPHRPSRYLPPFIPFVNPRMGSSNVGKSSATDFYLYAETRIKVGSVLDLTHPSPDLVIINVCVSLGFTLVVYQPVGEPRYR